jgi:hypothetical protein
MDDGSWRIACDERPNAPTFKTRGEAALAEYNLVSKFGTTAGPEALCVCGHETTGHLFDNGSSSCVIRPCACKRFEMDRSAGRDIPIDGTEVG